MIRQLLTPAAIAFTLITSAQLSPRTDAPLYRHMLEVNKQWSVMDPSLANDDRIVHFNNEGERIAKHLHLVRERLMAHHIADLPAAINEKRTTLLTRLDAYADRQRFPINEVLPYRNPVFIDPHGTACAVGQLMIESASLIRR